MFKYKGKTLHCKQGGNFNCRWYTFKNGADVPSELVDLVKLHGGIVEEIKPEKKSTKKE